MKPARKVTRIFDRSLNIAAYLAAVIIVAVMLLVMAQVIVRAFATYPMLWVFEVSAFSLLFITFLGTAWLLREEGHAKIDLLLTWLNKRPRAVVNIVTSIVGAMACLIVTWYGAKVTWEAFQSGHQMTQTSLLPPSYLLHFIIPVGSFLLFIQFLRRTYGYLRRNGTNGE